ncbi:hypothetical protein BCR36DRAFT_259335, partial [Piromyces finnis]
MNSDKNIYLNSTPEKYNILIDIENINNFLNIKKFYIKQTNTNLNNDDLENDKQEIIIKNEITCNEVINELENDNDKNKKINKDINDSSTSSDKIKDTKYLNINIIDNTSIKTETNKLLPVNNESITEVDNEELKNEELFSEFKEEKDKTIAINSYSDIDLLINKYTEKFDAKQKIHEVRSVENRQSFIESGRKVVEDSNIRIKNYHEGHDNINENIHEGPYQRRMSTIKLKTIYDENENIINITEDNYIKSRAEEIFGESLCSSNNENYKYEFISKDVNSGYSSSNIYNNVLPIIEDEDEENNKVGESTSINNNTKNLIKSNNIVKEDMNKKSLKDLNQQIFDEYYEEYKIEKEKLFKKYNSLEDIENSNNQYLKDNG